MPGSTAGYRHYACNGALEFFEVFVEQLAPRFDDGHRAAAHELLHAEGLQQAEQCLRLGLMAGFFDDDVVVVDLQDAAWHIVISSSGLYKSCIKFISLFSKALHEIENSISINIE